MVHFGQRLARERWAPWLPHYFDYDLLKRKLKAIQNASDPSEKDQAIQDFQHALDREIEKVIVKAAIEESHVHQIASQLAPKLTTDMVIVWTASEDSRVHFLHASEHL